MTGSKLATREPSAAIPAASDWAGMHKQATALVKSGFLPKAINTPEKALALMQTGAELGLGPMQAIRSVHIIEAKPTMSAELMAGLVFARVKPATLRVLETSNKRCLVHAQRAAVDAKACKAGTCGCTEIDWTIEDAREAKLTGKDNWRKYPRAMLRSRAISEACRAVFPDATMGVYTPDEMGAVTGGDAATVIDTEDVGSRLDADAAVDATPPKPAADPGPYVFKSGSHKGEAITDVPLDWLAHLATQDEHPINKAFRATVETEIMRRIEEVSDGDLMLLTEADKPTEVLQVAAGAEIERRIETDRRSHADDYPRESGEDDVPDHDPETGEVIDVPPEDDATGTEG